MGLLSWRTKRRSGPCLAGPPGRSAGHQLKVRQGGCNMFTLARRSPFEWMDQVERQMNSMFGRFFEPNGSAEAGWTPACEGYSRDGKIVARWGVAGGGVGGGPRASVGATSVVPHRAADGGG